MLGKRNEQSSEYFCPLTFLRNLRERMTGLSYFYSMPLTPGTNGMAEVKEIGYRDRDRFRDRDRIRDRRI